MFSSSNPSPDKHGWRIETTYAKLPASLWVRAVPEPVSKPQEVIWNESLAHDLGLSLGPLGDYERALLQVGHRWPDAATPLAQAYAGHQFGHLAVLGDGRAVLMGEHITPQNQRVDVQWKGSGRTRYSRRGDGRAALGPMLREYVISEAMHALGVPTSRSLAVALTGDSVLRERALPGAVLTRVAASHLRVGTVQWAAMQSDPQVLQTLIAYALWRHPPSETPHDNAALNLLHTVMLRQIDLVAHWARVGFVHGVMNTDNMTLSGETIDYGPCAFLDAYNPKAVFSSIDTHGRYAFDQQAGIVQWNLARLAEALIPAIHPNAEQAVQMAMAVLESYPSLYRERWLQMMRGKLGITQSSENDAHWMAEGLSCFEALQLDHTATFAWLRHWVHRRMQGGTHGAEQPTMHWPLNEWRSQPAADLSEASVQRIHRWLQSWHDRCLHQAQPQQSLALMVASNPLRIPRNHQVERVLQEAEAGDLAPLHRLLDALTTPYQNNPQAAWLETVPPASGIPYWTFCGT